MKIDLHPPHPCPPHTAFQSEAAVITNALSIGGRASFSVLELGAFSREGSVRPSITCGGYGIQFRSFGEPPGYHGLTSVSLWRPSLRSWPVLSGSGQLSVSSPAWSAPGLMGRRLAGRGWW